MLWSLLGVACQLETVVSCRGLVGLLMKSIETRITAGPMLLHGWHACGGRLSTARGAPSETVYNRQTVG